MVIGVNLFGAVLNFIYTMFFYRYTIKKVSILHTYDNFQRGMWEICS